jgi:hypothetical protein
MNDLINNYFRNLNTVRIVKWLLILLSVVLTITGLATDKTNHLGNSQLPQIYILFPFCFFGLLVPVIMKLNSIFSNIEIRKPQWNQNPYNNLKKPMIFFDFFSMVFFFSGFGYFIGTIIGEQHFYLDMGGQMLISAGLDGFVGNFLTLKWVGQNN